VSTSTVTIDRPTGAVLTRLADYLELTKPRIVLLELIVAAGAAFIAVPHSLDVSVVMHALWGTALIAASASVGNQWLERDRDTLMPRTADRPLPTGRVTSFEALVIGAITLVTGLIWLLWKVNVLTAALGLVSWLFYVVVYTPLKTRTTHNTTVGAVAGAIPVLMGWTATGAPLNLTAFSLAGVLFLWQFPHFMAIAWLYRRDYEAADQKMLTVVDSTGLRAGSLAVVGALFLIPVSLIPAVSPTGGSPLLFFVWTFTLGMIQLGWSIRFALYRDDASARLLLRATLLYLPAWLAMLLVVSL